MTTEIAQRVPSPAVAGGVAHRWREAARAYVALTKPRIIELLLITTVPAMLLAARELPSLDPGRLIWLTVVTLVGGTLAAGSANSINCYWDRDIDTVMARTRRRPLPAHAVSPQSALRFGIALGVLGCGVLWLLVNPLASMLTLAAIGIYVIVYTILLKRTTPQNIVIGGAAGALPPMIGWAAVTNDVSLTPLLLFLIVFAWTPPHFWALSIRLRSDYAAARVPMLPVVAGVEATNRQIVLYGVVLVALTLALIPVGSMGLIYVGGSLLLGAWFLADVARLWHDDGRHAIRAYRSSITYLGGLFAVIALDALLAIRV